MTYPTLAIIGTAGRKQDGDLLTHHHYHRMTKAAITFIQHIGIHTPDLHLVSGGAAWADHLVVTLALHGVVAYENVTLFLPATITEKGYVGKDDRSTQTASTANYYHQRFSQCTGMASLSQINEIGQRGATLIAGNGSFHARNSDVAKSVSSEGTLLAYTFGSPTIQQSPWTIRGFDGSVNADNAGLKDGGTADTWNKCTGKKWHAVLGPTEAITDGI